MGSQIIDGALVFSVISAIGALAYHAGALANRVESLEEWRRDINSDLKAIRSATDRLEAAFAARPRP